VPADIEKSQDFKDGMPFLGGAPWLDLANSSFTLDGNSFDFLSDDSGFALGRLIAGEPLSADHLKQLNELLINRTIHERLRLAGGNIELDFPDSLTGPIVATRLASNLAHFLKDYEPDRLKTCDNPTCAMLFYDRGKNNRRRWCTMSICGNRDKVANYRARKSHAKLQ
jgi:predicted RNA-binding Zn ribbon-like protein